MNGFRVLSVLMGWVLILVVTAPALAGSPVESGGGDLDFPKAINGYPVVFVQTPHNTVGLPEGKVILIVWDKAATVQESISSNTLPEYFRKYPLPEGWSITVVGGPGFFTEELVRVHGKQTVFHKRFGPPPRNRPGPSGIAVLGSSQSNGFPPRTYAMNANNDPWWYDLVFQSADWIAPVVGNNQDSYTVFTLNVVTDGGDFLQVGNYYLGGAGHVAWTSSLKGYIFHNLPLAYIPGHDYYHFIHYSGSPGTWYLGAQNKTLDIFVYAKETAVSGTKLAYNDNTGVFFENFNSSPNWYLGFSNPISAFSAWQSENPAQGYTRWGSDRQHIYDAGGNLQPNDGIITGTLAGGSTASWHLQKILLVPSP